MDINTKLTDMAINIGSRILCRELQLNKKHAVNEWCYEINLQALEKELFDDNHELVEMVKDNIPHFMRLVNNTVDQKLKYLYYEGFLRKEEDYYYVLSKEELESEINSICTKNND